MQPHRNTTTLLRGGRLVLPEAVIAADLLLDGSRIRAIGADLEAPDGTDVLDLKGHYLLAGFIDIHHHGALGFDYSLGAYDRGRQTFSLEESTYRAGVLRALGYFLRRGATRVFPTSLAAPMEDLELAFRQLHLLVQDEREGLGAMIGGINVEGTFLKLPAYAGAQSPDHFYPPSAANWNRLQRAANGLIALVNVPPEHGPEALAFIRERTEAGLVVSAGHTGAEADAMQRAIAAGTRLGVHFFNGPSRSSSKSFHDGGAEEALLRADAVALELIVDGYHVHPAYARDVMLRKGYERVVLITDSMFANGLDDLQTFTLCGVPGAVSDNRRYLQVTDRADTLFGSVLTSDRGLENVLNWLTRDMTGIWHRHHPALSLEDALVRCSQMASGNPARLMGIAAGEEATGSLREGFLADLVQVDIQQVEGSYRLRPERVWLRGNRHDLG